MDMATTSRIPTSSYQNDDSHTSDMQSTGTNPSRQDHSEGAVARLIEEQTAKMPSDVFLWAALGSIGCSLMLRACDRKHDALFVGQWAPTFLILGLYNKLVKVAGSDPAPRPGV